MIFTYRWRHKKLGTVLFVCPVDCCDPHCPQARLGETQQMSIPQRAAPKRCPSPIFSTVLVHRFNKTYGSTYTRLNKRDTSTISKMTAHCVDSKCVRTSARKLETTSAQASVVIMGLFKSPSEHPGDSDTLGESAKQGNKGLALLLLCVGTALPTSRHWATSGTTLLLMEKNS